MSTHSETYIKQTNRIMRFTKFNRYICFVFIVMQTQFIVAQDPIDTCNDNTYINSDDPNTIEYDNMVGLYHSTIIKEVNGTIKVWGERAANNGSSDVLSPIEVNSANGYNYQGYILKIAGGGNRGSNTQFLILTTEGLYAWGSEGRVIHENLTNGTAFGKVNPTASANVPGTNAYSLPMGVNPMDVKMMFGSYYTLAIVTHSGEAWILSKDEKFGDGSSGSSGNIQEVWHRIHKSPTETLDNVVAMRGNRKGMMALTLDGKVYTWGTRVYLGDGNSHSDITYATEMTIPSGTPKLIGMTLEGTQDNSHFLLMTNGDLYALGKNSSRQLGEYSTSSQHDWGRVKGANSNTNLPPIVWFSPNEHDARGYPAVNALTFDGKLWSWGSNAGQMIGAGSNTGGKDPFEMGRGLDQNDRLTAVETGGHTTMVIKQCSKKYGYIGHRTSGSMGDGTSSSGYESTFNFSQTADVNLCGSPTAPDVSDIMFCPGDVIENVNLEDALANSVPPNGYYYEWWTTEDQTPNTEVPDPTNVEAGTYYAFLMPLVGNCNEPVSAKVVVGHENTQLKLYKKSEFIDSNNNGIADVGEIIRYTFSIENTGETAVNDLEINDLDIGLNGYAITPSTIAPGQTIDFNDIPHFDYVLTQTDIYNQGVYNLAEVNGQTDLGCLITQTSVDPDPLGPGDDGYDPNNPDDTYTPLPTDIICTESVDGETFQWYESGGSGTVTRTITQPGANGGFQFDIYELDNSFNMEINGVLLAAYEIEFQSAGTPAPHINIEFADGDQYETDTEGNIWQMTGTPERPLIRVKISPNGTVKMYGSKTSEGILYPLQFKQNISPVNYFNIIQWNADSDNEIIVTQNIVGATKMDGYGSGQNVVPCETYTLEKDGVFNDENNDGIAQVGETITYTFTVKNAGDIDIHNLILEDPLLGGVINETPTGDDNNDGILNTNETWVYIVTYTVTQSDIDNKGVYNLASVSGENILNIPQDPETSVDPNPLDPNDPMFDPNRPNHTFVPLKGRSLLITNPNIYNRVKGN